MLAARQNLDSVDFENSTDFCACVVVASGGYPGKYEKGYEIAGLEEADDRGCIIFHAGTAIEKDRLVTAGGRVLGVTAVADDILGGAVRRRGVHHLATHLGEQSDCLAQRLPLRSSRAAQSR